MKNLKLVCLIGLCFFVFTCKKGLKNVEKDSLVGFHKKNIYMDQTLQKIAALKDERNSAELLSFFKDKKPEHRKAAVLAFASVQDNAAVIPLSKLFSDEDEDIRASVAYSIGQIGDNSAERILIRKYKNEKSAKVRRYILEAIGKCGTRRGLSFIAELKLGEKDELLLKGQAWGIYRFALKNVVSNKGTARSFYLIGQGRPEKVRFIAANYLSRARKINLKMYHNELITAYEAEKNIFTKMNIVLAMGKAKHDRILERLKLILNSDNDYRIKVNAIRALRGFEYKKTRDALFKSLLDRNVNIAVAASEYFLSNGSEIDALKYFDTSSGLQNWRSRINMLAASLDFASDKKRISSFIISVFKKSEDVYEKAYLLESLGKDPASFRFVESETFSTPDLVVRTYGMAALVKMRKHRDFDSINSKTLAMTGENLYERFASIFRRGIESEDTAMIGMAAGILRDPGMDFRSVYKNTEFLEVALKKCDLPEDIEAYLELKKTINFFKGQKGSISSPLPLNNPIVWENVTSIKPDQRVIVKTTKGNITIQLMVNESPGSVANFIQLIRENYYKKSVFHRVVPNFVIQDGCPRGDGWGGPSFSIRSEFGPLYYDEGSVGMASAGKDTEASQWFITHSPTPHLDGRYTIFGRVVKGMETVHKIEVGDRILGFEIIE